MLRLVKADLRQNAVWLIPAFVILAIGDFAVFFPGRAGASFAVGFGFGFYMLLIFFLRGVYYKSELLYRTLPVSHLEYVSAKYITATILFFGPAVYGFVFWDLLGFLLAGHRSASFQTDIGFGIGDSVIVRAAASWIAMNAILPIVLRWGSLSRIAALWILLGIIVQVNRWNFLDASVANAARFGMAGWILIVVLALSIIGLLSFRLSVWLFRHKEL